MLPENHPLSLGVVGSLGGNDVSRKMVEEADVILAIGFKFSQNSTYGWTIPRKGQKEIRIDIDETEMNKLHTTDVGAGRRCQGHPAASAGSAGCAERSHCCRKEIAKLYRAWREKKPAGGGG